MMYCVHALIKQTSHISSQGTKKHNSFILHFVSLLDLLKVVHTPFFVPDFYAYLHTCNYVKSVCVFYNFYASHTFWSYSELKNQRRRQNSSNNNKWYFCVDLHWNNTLWRNIASMIVNKEIDLWVKHLNKYKRSIILARTNFWDNQR